MLVVRLSYREQLLIDTQRNKHKSCIPLYCRFGIVPLGDLYNMTFSYMCVGVSDTLPHTFCECFEKLGYAISSNSAFKSFVSYFFLMHGV